MKSENIRSKTNFISQLSKVDGIGVLVVNKHETSVCTRNTVFYIHFNENSE